MCDRIAVIQNGKLIDIREMSETQDSFYYIEATPAEKAKQVLVDGGFTVEPFKDGLLVNAEQHQIPGLVESFIADGVQVYAVQPQRKTLEDEFLEMTGGGQIAEAYAK